MAVWLSIYKTILSNTVVSWHRRLYLFQSYCMLETALKYKICNSNICKGKVSNYVYESLRKDTLFLSIQMKFLCAQKPGGRRLVICRFLEDSFPRAVDPVEQLVGATTMFPQAFLILFYLKRLTEPILETLWAKTVFSPSKTKTWHTFELQAWAFLWWCRGGLLRLQSFTRINSNKWGETSRNLKEGFSLKAKQEVK